MSEIINLPVMFEPWQPPQRLLDDIVPFVESAQSATSRRDRLNKQYDLVDAVFDAKVTCLSEPDPYSKLDVRAASQFPKSGDAKLNCTDRALITMHTAAKVGLQAFVQFDKCGGGHASTLIAFEDRYWNICRVDDSVVWRNDGTKADAESEARKELVGETLRLLPEHDGVYIWLDESDHNWQSKFFDGIPVRDASPIMSESQVRAHVILPERTAAQVIPSIDTLEYFSSLSDPSDYIQARAVLKSNIPKLTSNHKGSI